MPKRNEHARNAANHHSTLNTFAAVVILLEGSLIYDTAGAGHDLRRLVLPRPRHQRRAGS